MINQIKENISWLLFCLFIILVSFISVLNLPYLKLKVSGMVGLGAFLTYVFTFGLLFPKLRLISLNHKITVFLGMIIGLLAVKYAISGSLFNLAKHIQYYLIALIFYYLGYLYIDADVKRRIFKYVFIGCAILLAIVGIMHYHYFAHVLLTDTSGYDALTALSTGEDTINTAPPPGVIDVENMRYRESATIPHPVNYAHILSFGIIFTVLCMRQKYKWIIVATLLYAIIISGTRSGLYYSILFISIAQLKFKKIDGIDLAAVLLVLLAAAYVSAMYKTFDITNIYYSGIYLRLPKILVAKELLFENISNLLIGLPLEVRPAKFIPGFGNTSVNDNMYLSILCEAGIAGFMIFLLLVRAVFSQFKKLQHIEYDPDTMNYIHSVKHCAIAFLVFGLTNSLHKSLHPTVFLFLFSGSIFSIGINNKYPSKINVN